jgi:hypothetical protein
MKACSCGTSAVLLLLSLLLHPLLLLLLELGASLLLPSPLLPLLAGCFVHGRLLLLVLVLLPL